MPHKELHCRYRKGQGDFCKHFACSVRDQCPALVTKGQDRQQLTVAEIWEAFLKIKTKQTKQKTLPILPPCPRPHQTILDDQGHLRFRVSISCKTWDGRSRKSKIPADRLGFSHALKLTKRYKIFRGHFLVIGWGCAARWGRIFTTGLTIMGLHFLLNSVTRSGVPYFRDSHQILTRHVDLYCQKRFWKSAVANIVDLETD